MNKEYEIIKFPKSRIGTFDVGNIGNKKHHVAVLLEIDVTNMRRILKKEKRNRKISFISCILKIIGETLIQHKEICSYLWKKNKKIVFNDISITIAIEKNINGVKVPIPLILENINEKTAEEINKLIEENKLENIIDKNLVLKNKNSKLLTELYYFLPSFMRIFILNKIIKNPFSAKKSMGNVMFTSIGVVGGITGWMIPKSYHNLCFAVGGIVKKPWVIKNNIEIREIMHMTVLINHDVVDGVPMAKFISNLARNIENIKEIE